MSKDRLFPCPVCREPREIRESKKHKPYVVCDPCGVQLFIRNAGGIGRFNELVDRAVKEDVWTNLEKLGERYCKKCPKCEREFWVEERLIETSWFNGDFVGYRCPEPSCDGIFKKEETE